MGQKGQILLQFSRFSKLLQYCVFCVVNQCFYFGEKVLPPPQYKGSSQFPPSSWKPTIFPLYVWKMSKYPHSNTSFKSNRIKMITNTIQENNAILNFLSSLWCMSMTNNFFKSFPLDLTKKIT